MAEIRLKSTGTIKLFESDNTSSVTIASPASLGGDRTITLPDGDVTLSTGTMPVLTGSTNNQVTTVTAANAIQGEAKLLFSSASLTVGNASEEDSKIIFDGNAQDYHIGIEDSSDDFVIGNNGFSTKCIVINDSAIVTMPNQPGFFGTTASVANCTGDGTELICTPVEVTDRNGDFSGTDFTAPVTGLYLINFNLGLAGLTASMTSGRAYIDTSNRGYYANVDWGAVASNGTNYGNVQTVIVDMDASDTMRFKVYADGGSKVADLSDTSTFGIWLLG